MIKSMQTVRSWLSEESPVLRVQFSRRVLLRSVAVLLLGSNGAIATAETKPEDLPADCSAYQSIQLPAEAEKTPVPKAFPTCASYRSYRGIGRPVNYAEARACARQERRAQKADLGQDAKEPISWVVGGSLILADIYFNGAGVKRDVPLAMRFACEAEEEMAMAALPNLRQPGPSRVGRRFEFCDYAATTFTMNYCGAYASKIEDEHRSRYFRSVKSSMTVAQRTAFEKLIVAQDAYIKAHADEVYQGGTIRVIRTLGSQSILKDLFHSEVVRFERKKWPVLSADQIKKADALLQNKYKNVQQRLRTRAKEESDDGGVTAEHLSQVQTKWESYREAWVAFAQARYPEAADVIRAQITLDRYRLLKTM